MIPSPIWVGAVLALFVSSSPDVELNEECDVTAFSIQQRAKRDEIMRAAQEATEKINELNNESREIIIQIEKVRNKPNPIKGMFDPNYSQSSLWNELQIRKNLTQEYIRILDYQKQKIELLILERDIFVERCGL